MVRNSNFPGGCAPGHPGGLQHPTSPCLIFQPLCVLNKGTLCLFSATLQPQQRHGNSPPLLSKIHKTWGSSPTFKKLKYPWWSDWLREGVNRAKFKFLPKLVTLLFRDYGNVTRCSKIRLSVHEIYRDFKIDRSDWPREGLGKQSQI